MRRATYDRLMLHICTQVRDSQRVSIKSLHKALRAAWGVADCVVFESSKFVDSGRRKNGTLKCCFRILGKEYVFMAFAGNDAWRTRLYWKHPLELDPLIGIAGVFLNNLIATEKDPFWPCNAVASASPWGFRPRSYLLVSSGKRDIEVVFEDTPQGVCVCGDAWRTCL